MSGLPEFVGETSPSFKKIIVDGVIGNVDSIGLEMLVYSTQRLVDKALESEPIAFNRMKFSRTAECELVMSPTQLKSVYLWLQQKLEEYEAIFGKIPSPEEIQSKHKAYRDSKNKTLE